MIEEQDILDFLQGKKFFLSGSRRFKTNREDSDYDICVRISDRSDIYNSAKSPINSDYNNGFKLNLNDKTINIIPLHPLDFVSWFFASKLMEQTPMIKEKTKAELHGLHETYIGLMKIQLCKIHIDNTNCINICNL